MTTSALDRVTQPGWPSSAPPPSGPRAPAHASLTRLVPLAILALAIIASFTSLRSGFAYDDVHIIERNARAHGLHAWWRIFLEPYWPAQFGSDVYRPLALLAFAAEWALGGGATWVMHLGNVLLYAAVCLAVYALARTMLPRLAASITAALFAVHPVHVEAVGNVVGQAELLVALATVLSLAAYLRARAAGELSARATLTICAAYAAACLAKEQGIMLPVLVLAAECTVVADHKPLLSRLRSLTPLMVMMAAVAAAYLAARLAVTGRLGSNQIHLELATLSPAERALTVLALVPEWVRLTLWPAQLSAFYFPPGTRAVHELDIGALPGLMLIAAVVWLAAISARRRPVVTFGLLWFAAALLPVSNLLFPSGVMIAERTLFLPSVGALLALGAGAAWISERWDDVPRPGRLAIGAVLLALLTAGAWRSAARQYVWRDNQTLFEQSVLDSPLSYESHHMYGRQLLEARRWRDAERELRSALALYQRDPAVYYALASEYREIGVCKPAIGLFRQAIAMRPDDSDYQLGLVACLLREARFEDARDESRVALRRWAGNPNFERLLAVADSVLAARSATGTPVPPARRAASGSLQDTVQNTVAGK